MKKLLVLIALIPVIGFYGCEKEELFENRNVLTNTYESKMATTDYCGEAAEFTLWAGQHINSGSLFIYNDQDYLYVTFATTGNWVIMKTHLHIASSLNGIPKNKQGIPVPGQFAYSTTHNPAVTEYTYSFLLSDLGYNVGDSFVVAAHAEVGMFDLDGNLVQEETAWGGNTPGPGNRWWYYATFTVQECEDTPEGEIEPGDFRTQTQGGWGSTANGNNPGSYRDANFNAAFPNGLAIGGDFKALFTSSGAVQNFLPQGGPAEAFSTNYINPTSGLGVFAGQVLALSLSVGFDLYDPNFGASSVNLKDLVFVSGPFAGKTVGYLLAEANRVLGGGSIGAYSIGVLNNAVASVNENFVDGAIIANSSLLALP